MSTVSDNSVYCREWGKPPCCCETSNDENFFLSYSQWMRSYVPWMISYDDTYDDDCTHSNTGTKMVNGDMTTFCYDCQKTLYNLFFNFLIF